MGQGISKLGFELIEKALYEPIAIHRLDDDLLHGPAYRQEVLVFLLLKQVCAIIMNIILKMSGDICVQLSAL